MDPSLLDPDDEDVTLDAKLAAAHEMGHEAAHREEIVVQEQKLIEKGFTPHTKVVQTMSGRSNESWWVKTPSFDWPSAVVLIALLIFVLIVVKVPG